MRCSSSTCGRRRWPCARPAASGCPIIALVDTNCDPDEADYVIPGNDDAIRSCSLIVRVIANAIEQGRAKVSPAEMAAPRTPAPEPEAPPAAEASAEGAAAETAPAAPATEPLEAAPPATPRRSFPPKARTRPRGLSRRRGEGGAGLMAEISAALVKELRERTSAGMMDCKRALEEAERRPRRGREAAPREGHRTGREALGPRYHRGQGGDRAGRRRGGDGGGRLRDRAGLEQRRVPRVRGARSRRRRASRARCRRRSSRTSASRSPRSSARTSSCATPSASRARRETSSADTCTPRPGRSASSSAGRGNPDVAYLLAQHISWTDPLYRTAADVPEAEIAAEREILEKQPDVASKPEEVRGKIVDGRIQKWLAERVLVDQEWIHESGKKVEAVLKEAGFEVIEFRRFALSE